MSGGKQSDEGCGEGRKETRTNSNGEAEDGYARDGVLDQVRSPCPGEGSGLSILLVVVG